jgi:hypothetical protein
LHLYLTMYYPLKNVVLKNEFANNNRWTKEKQNEYEQKLEANRQKLALINMDAEEKRTLLLKLNAEADELYKFYPAGRKLKE